MTSRSLDVDLGDGESVLTIVVKGCDCALDDLRMLLVGTALEFKRARKPKGQTVSIKPCGCTEPK